MATLNATTVNGTLRASVIYPYESVAHGGEDYPVFILPKIRYNGPDNIDPTHNDPDYFKALVKYICKKYPSTYEGLWIGETNPNTISTTTIQIYDTADLSNELPRYSSGTSFSLGGDTYKFGTVDYKWYFYITFNNQNYSNTLDDAYVRHKVTRNIDFQEKYGITNIAYIEGSDQNDYDSVRFISGIDAHDYGFCSPSQVRNGEGTGVGYLVTGSGMLIPSSAFVWSSTGLDGTKMNNGSYGGTAANAFDSDFMKSHSFMGSVDCAIDGYQWHTLINIVHRGYQAKENGDADVSDSSDNKDYGLQIISTMITKDSPLKFRHYVNGSYGDWIRVWDNNNLKMSYSNGVLSIVTNDNN